MPLDPTHTAKLRQAFRGESQRRIRTLLTATQDVLVEQNAMSNPSHPMMLVAWFSRSLNEAAGAQLEMFTRWFNGAAYQMVGGDWLRAHAERAYLHGLRAGEQWTKAEMIGSIDAIYLKFYQNELKGILDATVQQTTRAISTGLLNREGGRVLYRRVVAVTMKVMEPRLYALGHQIIVAQHNRGILTQLKAGGVKQVNVVPETLPRKVRLPKRDAGNPEVRWTKGEGGRFTGSEPGVLVPTEEPKTRIVTGYGKPFEVYVNPNENDIRALAKDAYERAVRVILDQHNNLYVWESFYAIHASVGHALQLNARDWDEWALREGHLVSRLVWPRDDEWNLQDPTMRQKYERLKQEARERVLEILEKSRKRAHADGQSRRIMCVVNDQDEVNILTAGDDAVCDDCQEFADGGPYDLEEVENTLPLHIECRCAWVPSWDRRFAINLVRTLARLEAEE